MKKMHKLGAGIATLAAAAVLALAGCGNTTAADSGSTVGSAAGTTTKDGYALVSDGTLTVGTAAEYEPFEYMEDGEYKGFDLELIGKVAEKLGLELKIENVDFDTIVPGVASGTKYDVGIAAISVDPKREKQVDFTDDYYMDDQAIVTMKDNTEVTSDNATEVLDSADKTIIAQSGSTAEAFAKENFPEATIKTLKNATECFSALQAGQGDALVTNRSVAARMVANQFGDCQMVKQVSTGESYAIAVSKDNPKLTEAINKALKELTDDGTVDELMAKYNV